MLNLLEIGNRIIHQRIVALKKESDVCEQFHRRQAIRQLADLIIAIIDQSIDELKSAHDGEGKQDKKRLRKIKRELEKSIEAMNEEAARRGVIRHAAVKEG